MRPLRQPTPTTCGQACVAMLAGVSVEAAMRATGKRGSTRTTDVVRGLQTLGLRCGGRLVPAPRVRGLVPTALVRCSLLGRSGWHWVVWHHGRFYDPMWGTVEDAEDFASRLGPWRITSMLPVEMP